MNELELLEHLLPHLSGHSGDLLIGAGEDDSAAWREPDGYYTVATCDTAVEGVHFDLRRQRPEDVGWRALAFALGDLAAKGARPTYGLVAISVPPRWAVEQIEGVYRGLADLAQRVGCRLVGGDTSRAPSDAVLTIAVLGVASARPIPRSAARAGWAIGVTGPLGGSKLTWARPQPRLELGVELCAQGLCCGDISDGLLRELDKFAAASGAGARLELDRVPRVRGVSALDAIASGEEVELVCVGPRLPDEVQRVGVLEEGGRVLVVDSKGCEVEPPRRGWDHFEPAHEAPQGPPREGPEV
ncbi:MAG: thiamine-monophosphate kinase [Candidatus Dormibacteraeota bacterium]|nr:thiamine-monophosphate kinase [Candidatus Dormibacteraeota bacterium]